MTVLTERLYGEEDFAQLREQSLQNERLRQHLNIHTDYSDPCQRLFVAMQPSSYVVPHRHTSPAKSETFIVLRGTVGILIFNDDGDVARSELLGPGQKAQVCDIPPGLWHTAVALDSESLFMEVKVGPYCPIDSVDVAPWAPVAGSEGVADYLHILKCSLPDQS